jgi:hypothetical protein
MATLTPIVFRNRLAAAASEEHFFLADHIDVLETDHPHRSFVELMCCYAGTLLRGELPGPYADADAELCVRNVLMPDQEFVGHWYERDADLAERFAVPLDQVRKKRLDLHRAERVQQEWQRGV